MKKTFFSCSIYRKDWDLGQQIFMFFFFQFSTHPTNRELAPPVLIFQTSPSCNVFTKNSQILEKLMAAHAKKAGHFYPDFGEIHASPRN